MTSHGDQNFFSNARNIVISGGTFTNVKSPGSMRHGFQLLLQNVAQGAFYNAAERGDPPRCHPQTRKAIRAEIMAWVAAPPGMRKLILWMYGPAGSGKTAIAQSIAEECARLGLLAASFFFWRTAAGRNDTSRFVATIAYQLSRYIPQMEEHLLTAIERDPTIFSLSLPTQMRVLVIDPLKHAAPSLPTAMFAIVDGVDECGPDKQSQSDLIHLLAALVSDLQHLPLIFLIASRPEYQIRKVFTADVLKPLTTVLVLDNDYKPDEDIKMYFDSTFRNICEEHRQLGRHLPSPWPTAADVDSLVSKASGQFIFASTVTKFIDSPRHNPADRIKIILRLSTSGNETPFALLDGLYRSVLDSVADVEKVLDILALILLDDESSGDLNDAEELLGIEFRSALIDLHSLLDVPPPSDTNARVPEVYHASLEDFLMDRSRSRQYYIGRSEGYLRLSRHCLKAMRRFPLFEYLTLQDVVYAFKHHAERSPVSEDLGNDLVQFDLRAVLEEISDFANDLYDTDWQKFFDGAKKLLGSNRLDIVLRLQNDFEMFLLDRIAQYPPSLRRHIPALLRLLNWVGTPGDLFRILLLGASNSAEQHTEFLNLDKRLLSINEARSSLEDHIYGLLFRDTFRARECFVDEESFVALAKAIVSVIYTKPGERNHQIRFVNINDALYVEDGCDPIIRMYIYDGCFWAMKHVLNEASTDWDLANFLRERTIQYRDDVEPRYGRMDIAEMSIRYIQRCEIPFLEHSHQPAMNRCAICEECKGAIVAEDTSTEQPSPPPSIEDIADPSSDSESEAHNLKANDVSSIRHEGIVTLIPSASHLPPISEWYASTATMSSQPSTSYAPSRLECDAQESATVPSAQHEALTTQVSSASTSPPSISEWHQNNDTLSAPQSKRKRLDTLAGPVDPPAYRFEGSQTGKRRKA